jgi:glycosyltransferase involved in cell wall biosynthesis
MDPLVSIVTVTYNHESYISKTIEGVLAQQVNFLLEFIIAEDCSTDGTLTVCRHYAELHPGLIRLITSDTNVGAVANERRAMLAAKGKYVALCEGDDYWSDPLKLQKQVDFLEAHPDYSVCFHRYKIYIAETNTFHDDDCGYLFDDNVLEGVEVTLEMFLHRWITQYLSVLYRRNAFNTDVIDKYKYYRDNHLIYHLLQNGKGFLFSFFGGVYNITKKGVFSNLSLSKTGNTIINVYKEIWKKNNDKRVREMYVIAMQHQIDVLCGHKRYLLHLLKYSFVSFFITFDINRLNHNIYHIIM